MINITCVSDSRVLFCESKSKDFSPVKLMTNHLWNGRHFIYIEGGAPDRGRLCDHSITLNHSMYRQLVTYWLIDYRSRHVVEWVTSCSRCLRGSTHFTETGWWDAHTAFSRTDHHWTFPWNISGRLCIIVMFALFAVSIIIVNVDDTVMCFTDGFRGRPPAPSSDQNFLDFMRFLLFL